MELLGKELLCALRSTASELRIHATEWPHLIPFVQSISHQYHTNAASRHASCIGIHCIKCYNTNCNILPDICVSTNNGPWCGPWLCTQLWGTLQNGLKPTSCRVQCSDQQPQTSTQPSREMHRPNFTEGNFVFVTRENSAAGEKFSLRWRGIICVLHFVNDYVYQVEDFRNRAVEDMHATGLNVLIIPHWILKPIYLICHLPKQAWKFSVWWESLNCLTDRWFRFTSKPFRLPKIPRGY